MRLHFDEVLLTGSEEELLIYLSSKRSSMPVLLFIQDSFIQKLREIAFNYLEIDSSTDYKLLRGLEKRVTDGNYPLLVTADEAAMRGNDYRVT
jgi:hypothetical protein